MFHSIFKHCSTNHSCLSKANKWEKSIERGIDVDLIKLSSLFMSLKNGSEKPLSETYATKTSMFCCFLL